MSGVSVAVSDAEVLRALTALAQRSGKLTPALRAIGQTLVTEVDLGFRNQRDPWGTPWEKLKPSTLARRRQGKGPGGVKILRDSGVLANAQNWRASVQADATSVRLGTNVEYAAIHQFGGDIQRAARAGTIYYKYDKRTNEVGNRFVKKSRSNFAQSITIGAHTIHIPPRPFLPIRNGAVDLPGGTQAAVLDVLRTYLAQIAP